METYNYLVSVDFSNGVNTDRLQLEISEDKSITIKLLGIKVYEDNTPAHNKICAIVFDDVLPAPEITQLDTVVSNHSGNPLPTNNKNTVGEFRYRTDGNNSYVDVCMQTGADTYEWVNVKENNW